MSGSARDLTACSASPSAWNPGPQLPLLRGISAALVSRAPPTKARRPRGPAPRPGRPARRTHLHVAVVVPGVAAVARVHQDGVEPVQDRLAAALRHVRAHVQELRVAHVLFGEQAGGGSNPPASGRASSSPVPPRTTPDSAAHGATWGNWARSHGGGGETGGREPSACARRVTEAPPPLRVRRRRRAASTEPVAAWLHCSPWPGTQVTPNSLQKPTAFQRKVFFTPSFTNGRRGSHCAPADGHTGFSRHCSPAPRRAAWWEFTRAPLARIPIKRGCGPQNLRVPLSALTLTLARPLPALTRPACLTFGGWKRTLRACVPDPRMDIPAPPDSEPQRPAPTLGLGALPKLPRGNTSPTCSSGRSTSPSRTPDCPCPPPCASRGAGPRELVTARAIRVRQFLATDSLWEPKCRRAP